MWSPLKLTSFSRRLYEIHSSCSVSASGSNPSSFLIWLRARLRTSRFVKLPRFATFSMLLVDSVKCLEDHAVTGRLVCRHASGAIKTQKWGLGALACLQDVQGGVHFLYRRHLSRQIDLQSSEGITL